MTTDQADEPESNPSCGTLGVGSVAASSVTPGTASSTGGQAQISRQWLKSMEGDHSSLCYEKRVAYQ